MIITTQRHPLNRWLDRMLTLTGWFVFSYLLAQGLLFLAQHAMNTAGFEQLDPIFPTLTTLLLYGSLLGMNVLLLLAWSRWHHRESRKHYLERNLYRQRLHISQVKLASPLRFADEHIDVVRKNQVVVLYQSPDGAVEHVKTPAAITLSENSHGQNTKLAELIPLYPKSPSNWPTPNGLTTVQSV